MARRAPKAAAPADIDEDEAATSQTTEVANWDEELAKQAAIAAGMEANTGGNRYFSLRGGLLTLDDMPIPGNRMAVVMLRSMLENVYYEGEYDPNVPQSPTCFAFGEDESELAPHPNVVEHQQAQNEICRGCQWNAFGTADRGKGKACANTRRIGMIPAGDVDESGRFKAYTDPEHFQSTVAAYMKLPVTSVKGYSTYVKTIAASLKRPPHAVFTMIRVVPDAKTQFKVLFEPISTVPPALIPIVMKRHEEVGELIAQPYPLDIEVAEPEPEKPAAGKGRKPAAKKAAKY